MYVNASEDEDEEVLASSATFRGYIFSNFVFSSLRHAGQSGSVFRSDFGVKDVHVRNLNSHTTFYIACFHKLSFIIAMNTN